MFRIPIRPPLVVALALLAACGSSYSPDTYATRAVQQANKVEQGRIVGRRDVNITAEGSTGAATGAAAGGVLGAQAPGGILSALGGVSGALVGGLVGTAAEHTVIDTKAFEYVVRTGKGDLLSVTQTDAVPLVVGQRVLVITGNQARVVPDYTTDSTAPTAAAPARPPAPASDTAEPAATSAPAPAVTIPPVPAPPVVVPPPPAPGGDTISAAPLSRAVQATMGSALPPIAQPVAGAIAGEAAGRP